MCPDPSASISVKRLLTSRSHTPRAERIKQLNSSCVIQLSSSMSNSCKKSSQTQLDNLPHFKHIHKPILTTEHTRVIHPYALTNYMTKIIFNSSDFWKPPWVANNHWHISTCMVYLHNHITTSSLTLLYKIKSSVVWQFMDCICVLIISSLQSVISLP